MKQKIVLDERTLNNLLQHVIGSARSCSSVSVFDHLKLLGEVLFENGVKCYKVFFPYVAVSLIVTFKSSVSLAIKYDIFYAS